MHAVAVDGPDDNALWRLVMVIADFARADGTRAQVGRRELEERVGVGNRRLPKLVKTAVDDGWLTVDNPGDKRCAATYSVQVVDAHRVHCGCGLRWDRVHNLVSVSAQTAATDVKTFNVRRASAERKRPLAVDNEPVDAYAHFPNWTTERFERENGDHP